MTLLQEIQLLRDSSITAGGPGSGRHPGEIKLTPKEHQPRLAFGDKKTKSEAYDVHYNGKHIGSIQNRTEEIDKPIKDSKLVRHGGFQTSWIIKDTDGNKANSYTEKQIGSNLIKKFALDPSSKKDAIDQLIDHHLKNS